MRVPISKQAGVTPHEDVLPGIRFVVRFVWPDTAKSDLRTVDRETAVRILNALTRYEERAGEIKALTGEWHGYSRLPVAEYRIIFLAALKHQLLAIPARLKARMDAAAFSGE